MGIIGGELGYRLLRRIAPSAEQASKVSPEPSTDSQLEEYFGRDFFKLVEGRRVIDFGCGEGRQAVEIARSGASFVVGLEIQQHLLERARRTAENFRVSERCQFATHSSEPADIIISKDAFEHFSDPPAILQHMSTLIVPDGCVLAAFGPTWLHPYGGHLFSVFPWSHLLFTEEAQIRWRSDFKKDGARKFSEVAGGLNQMTISRFERIVRESPFRFEFLEVVPIRGVSLLKSTVLREIGSSIVRCKLVLRDTYRPGRRGRGAASEKA